MLVLLPLLGDVLILKRKCKNIHNELDDVRVDPFFVLRYDVALYFENQVHDLNNAIKVLNYVGLGEVFLNIALQEKVFIDILHYVILVAL